MRYTTLMILLILHIPSLAQRFPNSYIDSAGTKKQARIEFLGMPHDYNNDERIAIADSGSVFRIVTADAIQEFSYNFGDHERYVSVVYRDKHLFMRVLQDGKHIKRLLWEGHKYFVEYSIDGMVVPHETADLKREWLSRVFAAYPLLSEMALNSGLDDGGYEDSLVIKEYDKWIDADSIQKKDTSMALRGMIDANLVKLPNRSPKPFELPVYNPQMMLNPDYALGYKLRVLTRAVKLYYPRSTLHQRLLAH